MNQRNLSAPVLEIIRMSTEDGPGIRTTVFLKGCSLKCIWCHNPESISHKPQLQWIENRCIGCNLCVEVCPEKALENREGTVFINRELCNVCGKCVNECPSTAMELLGQEWEVKKLLSEILKDRAFFEKSGGGITISGGEPTLKHEFVTRLLEEAKKKNIHTALDTCGVTNREILDNLIPKVDLILYDLKEIDPQKHIEFTGSSNKRVLDNLLHIGEYKRTLFSPEKLWIRTPIIPGKTDTEENIAGIGKFIMTHLDGVLDRWELCSFNNLCRDKYLRLGKDWEFKDEELQTQDFLNKIREYADNTGFDPALIHVSGLKKE